MNVTVYNLFRNRTGGWEPVGWQPEPRIRGTWSILSNCIITILLCVWTAVHLNTPEYGGKTKQNIRKVGWLFVGVLAPELVAFMAWDQMQEAKKLTKNMRKAHKWTNLHSLYAIMGGFAFSSQDLPTNFLRDAPKRKTLTRTGLLLLARCDPQAIPNLSVTEIEDKSKADGFKKLILCLQAGRFLASTVYRMSTGYTITLLELNTMIYCICALFVIIFWWNKPLDVSEPTTI
ncbi:hypothetical protein DM02DRAFT_532971, partial [Periconia macrospinosa]